jgi:hypothetical protein
MIIEFNGCDYRLITNYKYSKLIDMCCSAHKVKKVNGKVFMKWLIKNQYITKKENATN